MVPSAKEWRGIGGRQSGRGYLEAVKSESLLAQKSFSKPTKTWPNALLPFLVTSPKIPV